MIQVTIQDYYERMFEKYPSVPKSDIKRILQYGWKSLQIHNNYGGDTLIKRNGFWFYIGSLTNDSIKHFNYYKKKMCVKIRVLHKRNQVEWDGYYYFGLTNKQYEEYLKQKKKRGRPRKYFKFSHIILYKIFDECNIINSGRVAIFRIPSILDLGWSNYKDELITDKAELLFTRDPLKFEDILLQNYDYEFKKDKKFNNKKNK